MNTQDTVVQEIAAKETPLVAEALREELESSEERTLFRHSPQAHLSALPMLPNGWARQPNDWKKRPFWEITSRL